MWDGDYPISDPEKLTLYPYQQEAVRWLMGRTGALLSLDMGLGKTCVSLTTASMVLEPGAKILVICPAILRYNWQLECQKFAPWLGIERVDDIKKTRHAMAVSFEFATKHKKTLAKEDYDLLIVDESHNIKSPKAARTKAVVGKDGLIHKSKRAWFLSATPAPNGLPSELWTTLYSFGATELSYWDFAKEYCIVERSPWSDFVIKSADPKKYDEVADMVGKVTFRRIKEQVILELPALYYSDIFADPIPLTVQDMERDKTFFKYLFPHDKSAELLEKLKFEAEILNRVEGEMNTDHPIGFRVLEALAPSVASLRRYVGLQKAIATLDYIRTMLAAYPAMKLVIFAIHQGVIDYLHDGLKDMGAGKIYGATKEELRNRYVSEFQKPNSKLRVLVCNISVAGIGLNLTQACDVFMIEQSYTPSYNAQAVMRCHRIGQVNPVHVRWVYLKDSIDAKIGRILKFKSRDLTHILTKDDMQRAREEYKMKIQAEGI